MPFLDEQELASLQQEIHDANVKRDELEGELDQQKKELSGIKSKARGTNIFFALLSGIAFALATFLYLNKSSLGGSDNSFDATAFKQEEKARLLDSIANAQEDEIQDISTIEEDMDSFSNSTNNQTLYSVQIGVFSKKKFPLLSETIAGTTSQGNVFKYSLGLFKTLKEAQDFRRELLKVGFRDAFVASYINGERQKIHKPN